MLSGVLETVVVVRRTALQARVDATLRFVDEPPGLGAIVIAAAAVGGVRVLLLSVLCGVPTRRYQHDVA